MTEPNLDYKPQFDYADPAYVAIAQEVMEELGPRGRYFAENLGGFTGRCWEFLPRGECPPYFAEHVRGALGLLNDDGILDCVEELTDRLEDGNSAFDVGTSAVMFAALAVQYGDKELLVDAAETFREMAQNSPRYRNSKNAVYSIRNMIREGLVGADTMRKAFSVCRDYSDKKFSYLIGEISVTILGIAESCKSGNPDEFDERLSSFFDNLMIDYIADLPDPDGRNYHYFEEMAGLCCLIDDQETAEIFIRNWPDLRWRPKDVDTRDPSKRRLVAKVIELYESADLQTQEDFFDQMAPLDVDRVFDILIECSFGSFHELQEAIDERFYQSPPMMVDTLGNVIPDRRLVNHKKLKMHNPQLSERGGKGKLGKIRNKRDQLVLEEHFRRTEAEVIEGLRRPRWDRFTDDDADTESIIKQKLLEVWESTLQTPRDSEEDYEYLATLGSWDHGALPLRDQFFSS